VPDTTNATAVLYGKPVDEGGRLLLNLAADHDATFNTWVIDSFADDIRFFRGGPYQGSISLFLDQNASAGFGGGPIGANKLTVRGHLMVSTTGAVGGNGNVTATGYYYISDRATKDNIKPLKGLDIIMKLKGVEFTWKGTDKKGMGLIAQDVEKVLPELVETDPGINAKGVQYGNLVAPLIEAIKEQQSQIKQLRRELETLKANRF
jgi:hypothetical protein